MEQLVKVNESIIGRDKLNGNDWQLKLGKMNLLHERANCMCSRHAPEMYITQRRNTYYLARIPGSGQLHHPSCPSFDIDDDIPRDDSSGRVVISPAFPLSQQLSSVRSEKSGSNTDQRNPPKNQSTLKDLLRSLWWKADLNRWYPRMQGKRNWYVIRKHVREAASEFAIGKEPFEDHLFIPPPFDKEQSQAHQKACSEALSSLCSITAGRKNLALALGIAKPFKPSKYGFQVQIKHLPETVFFLRQALAEKLKSSNKFEYLGLNTNPDEAVVLSLLLVERTEAGNYNIVDAALLRTTRDFIPVRSVFEEDLASRLIQEGRSFIRALFPEGDRSDSPAFYLTDSGPSVSHLYISTDASLTDPVLNHHWAWHPAVQRLSETTALPPIVPQEKTL